MLRLLPVAGRYCRATSPVIRMHTKACSNVPWVGGDLAPGCPGWAAGGHTSPTCAWMCVPTAVVASVGWCPPGWFPACVPVFLPALIPFVVFPVGC